MPTNQTVPNLVNGISQQPASIRQPTQSEYEYNTFPSVVDGLGRRPPTQYVAAKSYTGTLPSAHIHWIDRDASERYAVAIMDEAIKVFDLSDGTEKTVTAPGGLSYLDTTDPESDFRAVTVADHTFIVNRSISVAASSSTTATRTPEALLNVRRGDYGYKYVVYIDGVEKASFTSSSTDVSLITTDNIAEEINTLLTSSIGSDFTIRRSGHVLHLFRTDGASFDVRVEDSESGASFKAITDRVQDFIDLPTIAPNGYRCKVQGDPSSVFDDYYVVFEADDSTQNLDSGVWLEGTAAGITDGLSASTMPHTLVRNSDGTFTFEAATWSTRSVGDLTSTPDPSFVGKKANNVFFAENRLGILCGANIVMSRTGEFFNFFRESALTTIDSDPIDIQAPDDEVHELEYAVQVERGVLLFSRTAQFHMGWDPSLAVDHLSITKETEYNTAVEVQPKNAGAVVFFPEATSDFVSVREIHPADIESVDGAPSITAHIPKLIAGPIRDITASPSCSTLALLANSDNRIFVYRYYWSGTTKLQSAWTIWQMAGTKVLSIYFVDQTLYLLMQHSDGVYLESVNTSEGQIDPNTQTQDAYGLVTKYGWLCHLDRRITEASLVSRTYDAATDRTTAVLPYDADNQTLKVVTRDDGTSAAPGVVREVISQSGTSAVISGDVTADSLWIGVAYKSFYRFSDQYMKWSHQTGGVSSVTDGRTQILCVKPTYARTGYFQMDVTARGRDVRSNTFTGRIMNDPSNVIGEVAISDGQSKMTVNSRNDRCSIDIWSDNHLPFFILSADFEFNFTARSRQL